MVAGYGAAWQAVFLSLPFNSGAACGAAPDGGAALWPRWCRCSISGLKASLAWLVIMICIS